MTAPEFCCTSCRRPFATTVLRAPMLTDSTWAKLAEKREDLCADCFFERARARRVRVKLADLMPLPFNVWHQPLSWFDLFSRGEPPEFCAAWLEKALAGLPEDYRARFDLGEQGHGPGRGKMVLNWLTSFIWHRRR